MTDSVRSRLLGEGQMRGPWRAHFPLPIDPGCGEEGAMGDSERALGRRRRDVRGGDSAV